MIQIWHDFRLPWHVWVQDTLCTCTTVHTAYNLQYVDCIPHTSIDCRERYPVLCCHHVMCCTHTVYNCTCLVQDLGFRRVRRKRSLKTVRWISGLTRNDKEDRQMHFSLPGVQTSSKRRIETQTSDVLSMMYLPDKEVGTSSSTRNNNSINEKCSNNCNIRDNTNKTQAIKFFVDNKQ
jgi:hypothetical protein